MPEDIRYERGAAFVGGKFVPVSEARIPILDWGFLRSDATYDVAHVWRGRFFRLEDHLERFERGVKRLHMRLPYSRYEITGILMQCVRLGGLREAYVEMICTRGVPPPGSRDPRECANAFYAFAVPFVWIADPHKQGLHAVIGRVRRIPPESVDPTIKNYHWLDLVAGLYEAYDRGGETVILTDGEGNVVEGPGFNVFAVTRGTAVTPAHGALEGVTRRTAAEVLLSQGVRVEERELAADELRAADEVFVTSTAGGIMPVTRVDGRVVGGSEPGPVTLRLREAYWRLHEDPRLTTPVEYG